MPRAMHTHTHTSVGRGLVCFLLSQSPRLNNVYQAHSRCSANTFDNESEKSISLVSSEGVLGNNSWECHRRHPPSSDDAAGPPLTSFHPHPFVDEETTPKEVKSVTGGSPASWVAIKTRTLTANLTTIGVRNKYFPLGTQLNPQLLQPTLPARCGELFTMTRHIIFNPG